MTAPTTLPTNQHAASAANNGPAYKKVSLIKDRVGMTRAPSFPLPPADHVYGMKMAKDPWSAGTGTPRTYISCIHDAICLSDKTAR